MRGGEKRRFRLQSGVFDFKVAFSICVAVRPEKLVVVVVAGVVLLALLVFLVLLILLVFLVKEETLIGVAPGSFC